MNDFIKELAEEAGLVYSGKNADGELEFIGDSKQWSKFEQLKKNAKELTASDDYDQKTCHLV